MSEQDIKDGHSAELGESLAAFDLLLQQLRDCHIRQLHQLAPLTLAQQGEAESAANKMLGKMPLVIADGGVVCAKQFASNTSTSRRAEDHGGAVGVYMSSHGSEKAGAQPTAVNHAPSGVDSAYSSSAQKPSRSFWRSCFAQPARRRGGLFRNALRSIGSLSMTSSSGHTVDPSWTCVASGCDSLARIMAMPATDWFFGSLIILNILLFALDIQVSGWDRGVEESFLVKNSAPQTYGDKEPWQSVIRFSPVLENVIGVAFVVEVLGKLVGLGVKGFANDPWNFLDAFVVAAWLLETVAQSLKLGGALVLRALRVLRAFRVLRLLKTAGVFDSLFLLNAAFRGCAAVLFWSLLYFLLVQITVALMMSHLINTFYLGNKSIPHGDREEVYQYFGTFSYATLTMFEMTLANWPPVCRVMMHHLSEWWVVFALFHKLTVGFAIVGIINGAVMQETFKAASQDQDVMVRDKQKQADTIRRSLRLVFASADRRKSGKLNVAQFTKVCSNPVVKLWLNSIGLNLADAEKVFKLIDDGDGFLTAEEFLRGVERLRGFAASVDLHVSVRDLGDKLIQSTRSQGRVLETLQSRISEQSACLKDFALGLQQVRGDGVHNIAHNNIDRDAGGAAEDAPETSQVPLPAPPASSQLPWHSHQSL